MNAAKKLQSPERGPPAVAPLTKREVAQLPFMSQLDLRAWFLWQLNRRGSGFIDVAYDAGMSRTACQRAFVEPGFARVEVALAAAVGLTPLDIWPGRVKARAERQAEREAAIEAAKQSRIKRRTRLGDNPNHDSSPNPDSNMHRPFGHRNPNRDGKSISD